MGANVEYIRVAVTRPLGVLIVDDMPQTRRFVCQVLEREGFQTFEAENGAFALTVVEGLCVKGVPAARPLLPVPHRFLSLFRTLCGPVIRAHRLRR